MRIARSSAPCQVRTIDASASRTGPGPVVELDRAADVDAARVDLDRHAPHPALEQRAQPRQAARLAHRRANTSSSNFAWYSRMTEICSSSREPKWANTPDLLMLRHLGQRADRQALEAHVRRQRRARRRGWRRASAGPSAAGARRRLGGPAAPGVGVRGIDVQLGDRIERSCYFARIIGRWRGTCGSGVLGIVALESVRRAAGRCAAMKIAVVGLGAVGGLIAARLARRRARGLGARARRDAGRVRERGLVVESRGTKRSSVPLAGERRRGGARRAGAGRHRAQGAGAAHGRRDACAPLLGRDDTLVLPAMNGVPWWFMPAADAATSAPLASVDPGGALASRAAARPRARLRRPPGCSSPAPGARAAQLRRAADRRRARRRRPRRASRGLRRARRAPASRPRPAPTSARDVWYKLWGNMTMNPVSALTGAPAIAILDDPLVRDFMLRAMAEAAAIGARIGCPIAQSGEDALGLTRQLGSFKTSMLQDADAGRPIELDALVDVGARDRRRVGVADAEHRRAARPDPPAWRAARPLRCRPARVRVRIARRRACASPP